MQRRHFLQLAATGAAIPAATTLNACTTSSTAAAPKIIGISTSHRLDKTTAAGVQFCLDAIKAADNRFQTELIQLANYDLHVYTPAGQEKKEDDFAQIAEKLSDPAVVGLVFGSPVYHGTVSSLCKIFIERCGTILKSGVLRNKVAGFVAVASGRDGGQEFTLITMRAALDSQNMIYAGDGHLGACFWNQKDSVATDSEGKKQAQTIAARMTELIQKLNLPEGV